MNIRMCFISAAEKISKHTMFPSLKAVYRDDNYIENDKDIVLIIKEQQSPHHNYNDKGIEKQYCLNYFQNDFLPADEQ